MGITPVRNTSVLVGSRIVLEKRAYRNVAWLKTVPEKGYFVIFRLYSPTKAFFDASWKSGDIEKVK
jgi:hypothetical protein